MKRNMQIIRDILLKLHNNGGNLESMDGVSHEEFTFHADLLQDAGFVKLYDNSLIERLTWQGHDIAESIQDLDIRNINWKEFTRHS